MEGERGRVQSCSSTSCIISSCPYVQCDPDVWVSLEGDAVKYCFKALRVNHKCCTGDLMKNARHTPPQLEQSTDGPHGMRHVGVASCYDYSHNKKGALWR